MYRSTSRRASSNPSSTSSLSSTVHFNSERIIRARRIGAYTSAEIWSKRVTRDELALVGVSSYGCRRDVTQVWTDDIEIDIEAALEIRALGETKRAVRFGLLGGSGTRGAKATKGPTRTAREDEDAFAEGVRQLPFLELPVLHRRQEVLQPAVMLRVELIEEGDGEQPLQPAIADLVERTNEIPRVLELREVELHPGIRADQVVDQLGHGERLACARRTEDADGQRLLPQGRRAGSGVSLESTCAVLRPPDDRPRGACRCADAAYFPERWGRGGPRVEPDPRCDNGGAAIRPECSKPGRRYPLRGSLPRYRPGQTGQVRRTGIPRASIGTPGV